MRGDEPNIYAPRTLAGSDTIDRALSDALADALDMEDLLAGWMCIEAQLDFYGLRGSDAESSLLSDYTAGVEGIELMREVRDRTREN